MALLPISWVITAGCRLVLASLNCGNKEIPSNSCSGFGNSHNSNKVGKISIKLTGCLHSISEVVTPGAETENITLVERFHNERFANLSFSPKFNKTLALVIQPTAQYILLIANEVSYGRKTNNLKISVAKNFLSPSDKQLGVFMEELKLGGGHDNAAGGMIRANSKNERLKKLHDFQLDLLDFINT